MREIATKLAGIKRIFSRPQWTISIGEKLRCFLVGVEDDLRWWTADTAVQLLQFLERENRRHQPTEIFKMREKIFQIFREMFLAMTSKLF